MNQQNQIIKTKPLPSGIKIGFFTNKVFENCAKKVGFSNISILKDWRNIVGDKDIADSVKPIKITKCNIKNEYTIHVKVLDLGAWSVWKMMEESVIDKCQEILVSPCKIKIHKRET